MSFGMHGKMLQVDLTSGTTSSVEIPPTDVASHFLGSGLAAKSLYDDLDPTADALSPESPLLMVCGLFTGSPLPGTTKISVCARSPLTGIWNEATAGGHVVFDVGANIALCEEVFELVARAVDKDNVVLLHARSIGE